MAQTRIKTAEEIAAMRRSGKMLATVLQLLAKKTKAGLTPKDMSALAEQELQKLGGEPAFKNYHGFPDIICISVNDQVQHTIPDVRAFQAGDVINYDFGVRYKGMITDAGITVCIGKPSEAVTRLITGTQAALAAGIAEVRDGCKVGDISAAIEAVLKKHRLSIVRDLVGHGVGHDLHEEPNIPNYGKAGTGATLKAGMTIAIEPITTLGAETIMGDVDGWTLWTTDRSLSAQFEHTVLVTKNGAEILTQ